VGEVVLRGLARWRQRRTVTIKQAVGTRT